MYVCKILIYEDILSSKNITDIITFLNLQLIIYLSEHLKQMRIKEKKVLEFLRRGWIRCGKESE